MHALLTLFLLATSAALAAGSTDASDVVTSTIRYRRIVIDPAGATAFERCAAAAAAGHAPQALDSVVGEFAASALSAWTGACPKRTGPRSRSGAVIESVAIADSTAEVRVRVFRGEWSHHETYNLRRRPVGGDGWGVRDVRIWGVLRIHPVRSDSPD
jgi:hypothetical protein